jgi:nucleoside-diphosphate-sugar epimerase
MPLALVTGGAGFIGSHVVDRLISLNYYVRVLDDLSTGSLSNLSLDNENLEFFQGSIEDKSLLSTVCKDVDLVIHLAAMVSVPGSVENPERSTQINGAGFMNVLNTLRDQDFKGRFVYASSSAVYGDTNSQQPITESLAPGHLLSPYAVDKYTNELYAGLYAELYGMNTLGFRFFNVYGPRQDPSSSYSGVISIFMNRAKKNEAIGIYGNGQQTRDFVFVTDVARILCSKLKRQAYPVYNIGTGVGTRITELADAVKSTCNANVPVNYLPARAGDILYSCANVELLVQATGSFPKVKLSDGLLKLKDWSQSSLEGK